MPLRPGTSPAAATLHPILPGGASPTGAAADVVHPVLARHMPPRPGVQGARIFHAGAWWSWGPGWQELRIATGCRWSEINSAAVDPQTSAYAAQLLASSGGLPVSVVLEGLAYLFLSGDRGLRVFVCSPPDSGELGALPAPPMPVVVAAHPRGMPGVRKSTEEVATKIKKGCTDRRVYVKARQLVADAHMRGELTAPRGYPDPTELVEVFRVAVLKGVVFVQDPWDTEAMAGAPELFCLDGAECIPAGDCDDQLIALGSLVASVGIPVRLRVRYYAGEKQAHVTLMFDSAVRGGGPWLCVDPSLDSGACSSAPYEREILVDVCTEPNWEADGAFLGLGAPEGMLGAPFVFMPSAHTAGEKVMADQSVPTQLHEAPSLGAAASQAFTPEQTAAWITTLSQTGQELAQTSAHMRIELDAYKQVRADLGIPPNDPAVAGPPSPSPLADFAETGDFTPASQAAAEQLIQTTSFLSQAIDDAVAGRRALVWNAGDLLIEAKPGDLTRVLLVDNGSGVMVPTVVDPNNQPTGQIGAVPVILIGVVVAVATIASCIAVIKVGEYAAQAYHDWSVTEIATQQQKLVDQGKADPASVAQVIQAQSDLKKAFDQEQKQKGLVQQIVEPLTQLAQAAAAIAVVALIGYAGFEIYKTARAH